jgi:hypothetical protein
VTAIRVLMLYYELPPRPSAQAGRWLNGIAMNGIAMNGLNRDGLAQAVDLNFDALKLHAVVLPTDAQ